MNRSRNSSCSRLPPLGLAGSPERNSFEGLATTTKVLLKLIQDHQEAANKAFDERKESRMSGMIAILDELKTKIQTSQSSISGKTKTKELRRCFTDLKGNKLSPGTQEGPVTLDDKEKLRRELNLSFGAQKRLGVMCSSLGKEKQIIATELSLKVQEIQELEELVSDLKSQNERLSEKVKVCALEHTGSSTSSTGIVDVSALQERNKELSEHLMKSLDGFRGFKKKLKETQDENTKTRADMVDLGEDVASGIRLLNDLSKILAQHHTKLPTETDGLMRNISCIFERLAVKLSKKKKQG